MIRKIFILNKIFKKQKQLGQQDYLRFREQARKIITDKVEFFSKKYHFQYNRIAIKNTKTRWGSCSVKRNLNFNYRIIFLDEDLQNYIIIHELCHLRQMNHSKEFWKEVEKILPNYRNYRQKLKKISFLDKTWFLV